MNAPEPANASENGLEGDANVGESPEDPGHAQVPRNAGLPTGQMPGYPQMNAGLTPEQQAMQYGGYMGGRPAQGVPNYPMPPGQHMAPQPHAQ